MNAELAERVLTDPTRVRESPGRFQDASARLEGPRVNVARSEGACESTARRLLFLPASKCVAVFYRGVVELSRAARRLATGWMNEELLTRRDPYLEAYRFRRDF